MGYGRGGSHGGRGGYGGWKGQSAKADQNYQHKKQHWPYSRADGNQKWTCCGGGDSCGWRSNSHSQHEFQRCGLPWDWKLRKQAKTGGNQHPGKGVGAGTWQKPKKPWKWGKHDSGGGNRNQQARGGPQSNNRFAPLSQEEAEQEGTDEGQAAEENLSYQLAKIRKAKKALKQAARDLPENLQEGMEAMFEDMDKQEKALLGQMQNNIPTRTRLARTGKAIEKAKRSMHYFGTQEDFHNERAAHFGELLHKAKDRYEEMYSEYKDLAAQIGEQSGSEDEEDGAESLDVDEEEVGFEQRGGGPNRNSRAGARSGASGAGTARTVNVDPEQQVPAIIKSLIALIDPTKSKEAQGTIDALNQFTASWQRPGGAKRGAISGSPTYAPRRVGRSTDNSWIGPAGVLALAGGSPTATAAASGSPASGEHSAGGPPTSRARTSRATNPYGHS